jgi:hypothetical protein
VVPILGGVLGFAAGLLALGAGWMWAQDALRPPPSGPALAPPAAGPTEVAPA